MRCTEVEKISGQYREEKSYPQTYPQGVWITLWITFNVTIYGTLEEMSNIR